LSYFSLEKLKTKRFHSNFSCFSGDWLHLKIRWIFFFGPG